jgi:hypothetical protein
MRILGANWLSYDHDITILPLVLRNMSYHGAEIHHLFVLDQTRVGDVTHIPCNAVPPDRGNGNGKIR